jgi:MFS family permease
MLTAPFVGKLSDKIGSYRLIKISLFLSGSILFVYQYITNFTAILVATLLWSTVSEASRPATLSIISHIVPVEKRKTAFTLNRLMINLGMSIGPVAAGFLIKLSFSIIFFVDAITSVFAGIFLLFFNINIKQDNPQNNDSFYSENTIEDKRAIKDRILLYFIIALLPVTMVIFQFFGAMPLFLVKELHFDTSTIGLVFAVNTVMIIFLEVPLSTATSKWTDKKSLALGSILLGTGFGAMVFASGVFSIVITVVIWTFGEMILWPSSATYISEIAPPQKRGEYMGYLQFVFSLALTLGPWLGIKVYDSFGSGTLWTATFFISALSAMMMLKLRRK